MGEHAAKLLRWLGSSLHDVRRFPADARNAVGHQLWRVQSGLMPNDFKQMKSIAPGVVEIRVHTLLEHRVIYASKFEEAIYVLHAFEKRARKTPDRDLEIARRRLAEFARHRQAR